ncbi:MAG: hypothetical protein KAQ73_00470, partial [Dehalococcoidia bacterium]|nr:hypothetical protein [Dehalococcoidia bacterium]
SGEVLAALILRKSLLRLTPALVADQYDERYPSASLRTGSSRPVKRTGQTGTFGWLTRESFWTFIKLVDAKKWGACCPSPPAIGLK